MADAPRINEAGRARPFEDKKRRWRDGSLSPVCVVDESSRVPTRVTFRRAHAGSETPIEEPRIPAESHDVTAHRCFESYCARARQHSVEQQTTRLKYPLGSLKAFAEDIQGCEEYTDVEVKRIKLGPNIHENTVMFLDQAVQQMKIPEECLTWRLRDAEEYDTDWNISQHLVDSKHVSLDLDYPTLIGHVRTNKRYGSPTTFCIDDRFGRRLLHNGTNLPTKLVYCIVQEQGLKDRFEILLPACFAVDVFAQDETSTQVLKQVIDIVQPSNHFLLSSLVAHNKAAQAKITPVIAGGVKYFFSTSKLWEQPELGDLIAVSKAQRRESSQGDAEGDDDFDTGYVIFEPLLDKPKPRHTSCGPSFFSRAQQSVNVQDGDDSKFRKFVEYLFGSLTRGSATTSRSSLSKDQTVKDYILKTPGLKSMYDASFEKHIDNLEREWLCYEKQHSLARKRPCVRTAKRVVGS